MTDEHDRPPIRLAGNGRRLGRGAPPVARGAVLHLDRLSAPPPRRHRAATHMYTRA